MSNFRYAPCKHAHDMCYNCGCFGGHDLQTLKCGRIDRLHVAIAYIYMIKYAENDFFERLACKTEDKRYEAYKL